MTTPTTAVRIIQGAPCLVYLWPEPPAPHVAYSHEHDLVARVWRVSEGQRWHVAPFHAFERDGFVTGARLVLDDEGYVATRRAEELLERVRADLLAGGS